MNNDPSHDPERTINHTELTGSFQQGLSTEPTLTPTTNDLPLIPGYRITRELARGGMGRVLAGVELSLAREVAIKVILPLANPDRFLAESKITAQLPHPSIPPIYTLGTLEDGSHYLAMKYVRGNTLADELKARPDHQHELPRFVQVFEQICQAVGFAHAQHIIHRDLKPANVMLGAFGEVQVMDWGLAKELQHHEALEEPTATTEENHDLTRVGTVMGTPAYMAPEQARGESLDARADVFALGGILCSILTGRAVHTGASASETISNAATGQFAAALQRLDSCSADPELVRIAKNCLAVDREQRPADAVAVAMLVAAYRQGVVTRLQQAETERAAGLVREAEQHKRRRLAYRLGGAVLAILLMGIAGTTFGMVRANRAADAERIAKTKAENRLQVIRATINQFVNELPSIGEYLPLTTAIREELVVVAKTLIMSIRDESDLNDTYDFGLYALDIREAQDAEARGDKQQARAKIQHAQEGFRRILAANPQALDLAKNNLSVALTQQASADIRDKQLASAEVALDEAFRLRLSIEETPHGDMPVAERTEALAITQMLMGNLELVRAKPEAAEGHYQAARERLEHLLQQPEQLKKPDKTRFTWTHCQANLGRVAIFRASKENEPQKAAAYHRQAIQFSEASIVQLQKDLQANPTSAILHRALEEEAGNLSHFCLDTYRDPKRVLQYAQIATKARRWFWDSAELVKLREDLGSNYYELGIWAKHNQQHADAAKYFRQCLAFWEANVHSLEAQGEPANSLRFADRKILQMLARCRCGVEMEQVVQFAAELVRRAPELASAEQRRDYYNQAAVGLSFMACTFPEASKQRHEYFVQALATVRRAVAEGYDNWNWYETDEDFEALREFADFREAVSEWKKPKR